MIAIKTRNEIASKTFLSIISLTLSYYD